MGGQYRIVLSKSEHLHREYLTLLKKKMCPKIYFGHILSLPPASQIFLTPYSPNYLVGVLHPPQKKTKQERQHQTLKKKAHTHKNTIKSVLWDPFWMWMIYPVSLHWRKLIFHLPAVIYCKYLLGLCFHFPFSFSMGMFGLNLCGSWAYCQISVSSYVLSRKLALCWK